MSKKALPKLTVSQTRRKFLKRAAYTSALSVVGTVGALGGLINTVFANNEVTKLTSDAINSTNHNGINIMQQQMLHKEAVTLFNTSDDEIMLDALHPVHIARVNGSLQIKPNFVESELLSDRISDLLFDLVVARALP